MQRRFNWPRELANMKSARLRSVARDATGALAGALTVVPIILSCGAVLYESMGPAWVTAGRRSCSYVNFGLVRPFFENSFIGRSR